MAITVTHHLSLVHAVLARYDIPVDWLEVVPDVQQWCKSHQIPESNPHRAAKCFTTKERCHIVMRDDQTDSMIESAKSLMALNGLEEEVENLRDDTLYLLHLLLHEIACFKLQDTEQTSRDQWAFEEMVRSE